jgi:hypothetical protein
MTPLVVSKTLTTDKVHPGATLKQDLRALAKAVQSESRCPRIASEELLELDGDGQVIGARIEYQGKSIVALRREGLTAVVQDSAREDALLEHLQFTSALLPGHGRKRAQQLDLPARINGKLVRRPRYLIIDAKGFAKITGQAKPKRPKRL